MLLWQATETATQSHPVGNRMRLGTFLLWVKVFYECEKLWSDTYATKPVERSMAKIKYLNLKNLTCLDCLYLIILKIDRYGTDCLEGGKRRHPLSELSDIQIDLYAVLCTNNTNTWLKLCSFVFICRGTPQFWGQNKKRSHVKKWINWSAILSIQVISLPMWKQMSRRKKWFLCDLIKEEMYQQPLGFS